MISKNDVKYIQTLFHKKNRDAEGLFIAEGPKLVNDLLLGGLRMKQVYALPAWAEQHPGLAHVTTVTQAELERLSYLQTPNQVLALVHKPAVNKGPFLAGRVVLVLDGIQDPGNLGTILRIADWFGISEVVASEDTADLYNPKVVQATMGSIARVSVWYKQLDAWLPTVAVPVFGALLNGVDINSVGKIAEGLLVIGNEGRGIRPEVLPFIKQPLTIPGKGQAESLNAAVAAGIILSHIC